MNRAEHLAWCKNRALEYVSNGDLGNAFASMVSDLGKHEDTDGHIGIELGMGLSIGGMLSTEPQMKEWIIGFN